MTRGSLGNEWVNYLRTTGRVRCLGEIFVVFFRRLVGNSFMGKIDILLVWLLSNNGGVSIE